MQQKGQCTCNGILMCVRELLLQWEKEVQGGLKYDRDKL
jgi:hypothetical protein